jgi:hypothetical protein
MRMAISPWFVISSFVTLMVFVPVVKGRTRSADQKLGFVANGVSCSSCVQQDLSCM